MAKAKFDIKTEATRSLLAGVGAADLAVEAVRDYLAEVSAKAFDVQKDVTTKVAGVQRNVAGIDYTPAALRSQAVTVVNARVEALTADAKTRRAAIEARVAELQAQFKAQFKAQLKDQLQAEAKALPARVQTLVNDNVATVNDTYADLAKRGELLVGRIRKQESTKATVKSAKTTVTKAKTTRTQATKAAESTATVAKTAAKKASTSASTAAKKSGSTAASSAKATATAAKKTASSAVEAVVDAAEKIGD